MGRVLRGTGRSRVYALLAASVVFFASAELASAGSDDQTIVGVIDQARLVKIPVGTQTLVIGNQLIADVTLVRQDLMILTPKSFGETNFIALDDHGNPLAESTILVVNGTNALVVQRGMDRESYNCAPRCQPVARLGDDDKYLSSVASQARERAAHIAAAALPTQPRLALPH